jgi:hypothetical protein
MVASCLVSASLCAMHTVGYKGCGWDDQDASLLPLRHCFPSSGGKLQLQTCDILCAGKTRNEQGDAAVDQAIAGAEAKSATAWGQRDGDLWRFSSTQHAGTVWQACLAGGQSTCICRQVSRKGVCKHVAYGLQQQGVSKLDIF